MSRKNKKIIILAEKLCKELDKSTDIFFDGRPFLGKPNIEAQFADRTDEQIIEKIENDSAIEVISLELTKLLPEPEPEIEQEPEQEEMNL